jgi:uncharacterized ferritin-like protein (DUF455 family)
MIVRSAQDFCHSLLTSGDLTSKLRSPRDGAGKLLPLLPDFPARSIDEPAREPALRQQKGAGRLPGFSALQKEPARIECLRRFAHHELQAIELFAWAVLRFPTLPGALLRGFLLVLEEEQQHLRLYIERLRAHGAGLGDGQLSDYLWQHRSRIEEASEPALAFLCVVGLTFEQANLDFAPLYRDAFAAAGDPETAAVLQRIHDDEIRHVRLAVRWLRRLKAPGESDWQAYERAVPFPLSAARAKGRRFDLAARRQAGFDDEFIARVAAAEPYKKADSAAALEPDRAGRLWLLPNLGAEEAQAVPAGARGFLRGLYGAWAALFERRLGLPWLLPPGDEEAQLAWREALGDGSATAGPALACLSELSPPVSMLAWLNTAAAEETAQAHRLTLRGPAAAVVLGVHDKAYAMEASAALGLVPGCLRGLAAVFSAAECAAAERAAERLSALVLGWPDWTRRRFVLKPRLSTSGRGRFIGRMEAGVTEPRLTAAVWAALARRGGCVVEPWLDRLRDLSVQLMVRRDGVEVLGTTEQILTPSGQIRGNRGLLDESGTLRAGVEREWEAAVAAAAQALGAAAAQQGFYGIAGVDAFLFRGPDEQPVLRPIVELNARFTTGTIALGLVRRLEATGRLPRPGAWALLLKAPAPEALAATAEVRGICPLPRGPALLFASAPGALDRF